MMMDHEVLGSLFELSRDAVIGVENGKICFANPAAGTQFALYAGADAAEIFPPELFDGVSRGVVALRVNEREATLSVRQQDGLTLLYLHPAESDAPTDHPTDWQPLRVLSDSLMSLRMALDALFKLVPRQLNERVADYSDILYRSYYRLRRLHSHMSIARNLQDGTLSCSPTIIDLEQTMSDLVDSACVLTAPLGVHLRFSCSERNLVTVADRDLLEIMVLNLLSNSLLHCSRGGHISVALRRSGKGFILSVDDDGCGMNNSALLHAFSGYKPFDPTNALSGCGCGLVIAKGIAEKHGGVLMIESATNKGCHVRIFLPRGNIGEAVLCNAAPAYGVRDMNQLLTEFSVVLPANVYQDKYFD